MITDSWPVYQLVSVWEIFSLHFLQFRFYWLLFVSRCLLFMFSSVSHCFCAVLRYPALLLVRVALLALACSSLHFRSGSYAPLARPLPVSSALSGSLLRVVFCYAFLCVSICPPVFCYFCLTFRCGPLHPARSRWCVVPDCFRLPRLPLPLSPAFLLVCTPTPLTVAHLMRSYALPLTAGGVHSSRRVRFCRHS